MTIARKTQIGLLITAVVLFVLLFLAPKNNSGKTESMENTSSKSTETISSIETFISMASKSLKPEDKSKYDALLATAKNSKIDSSFIPVVEFWDKQKRPDFAAYFVEQIAERKQNSQAYTKAGDRYYYAVRFTKDNNEWPALYQSAIRCYEKAIAKDVKT